MNIVFECKRRRDFYIFYVNAHDLNVQEEWSRKLNNIYTSLEQEIRKLKNLFSIS